MGALYHFTAARGAEACGAGGGKCTQASSAAHYTSWEAADAQSRIAPPRMKKSEEHTLPAHFTWRLVKAMAMVFAEEIAIRQETAGVIYALKSGDVPYQIPFEQLRSEKYVEITPKRKGALHPRISPTIRGMMQVKDARILGALHTWAKTHGVQLTPSEAQELFNGYRAGTPVIFAPALGRKIITASSADFFTDLRSVVTNLLELENTTIRKDMSAEAIHGSYVVERAGAVAATITPYPDGGTFAITWKTTSGSGVDAGWSFPVDSPEDGLKRYFSWSLAHPPIETTRR